MITIIRNLLSPAQIAAIREGLATADWQDGRVTAGPQSALAKANQQVSETCPQGRALSAIITTELERHPLFLSAALPRHLYPPLFNRYAPGMSFGAHIDNALRTIPGTPYRIRTDLSATLFLEDPENYDGGELQFADGDAQHSIKRPAGDLVLYPANTLHLVTPVTRGTRLAAFFWVQSLIKDNAARAILHDMDIAIRELAQTDPNAPAVLRLTGSYHNLVRRWAEL